MRRLATVAILACGLAACAGPETSKVQTMVVGRSQADVESCLGVPAHKVQEANNTVIEEWNYSDKGGTASVPLSSLAILPLAVPLSLSGSSISLSGEGNCNTIVTLKDGKATGLVYSGDSFGLGGHNDVCVGIIRGCLHQWTEEAKATAPAAKPK